jgi:hypothetical protein
VKLKNEIQLKKDKKKNRVNLQNMWFKLWDCDNLIKNKSKKIRSLIKKNIQLKKDKKSKHGQFKSSC